MATPIPPSLKRIQPYMQRASEMERVNQPGAAVVSYFCRVYALEQAIEIFRVSGDTAGEGAFIAGLMSSMEAAKAGITIPERDEAKAILKQYAMSVFKRADDLDRAGSTDEKTAKSYSVAGSFFDVMKQFGEQDPDVIEMSKYAKWKAIDIMKALKEGRQPVSGPPPEFNADFGADGGFMLPPPPTEAPGAGAPAAMPSLPMPPTTTPALPYASPTPFQTPAPTPAPYQPPAPAPAPYQPPAPVPAPAAPYHPPAAAPSTRTPGPGAGARHNQFLPAQFKDAIEESKYAIQFSEKQNAAEAIKCLENAIRYLRK